MAYFEVNKKPPLTFPPHTDSIVTFNSQYAGLPLKSHTIALTATQSGSGTPSPQNIRSINGYSAIGVSATGLNLWGGNALLQSFINANISGFSYDTTLKTLSYGAPQISGKVMPLYGLKANTQYTFILTTTNTNHTGHVNLHFLYSDNSSSLISAGSVDLYDNKTTFAVTSSVNKTLVAIRGVNYSGTATLYYDECCLLEGVKTVDDFEPFGTYTTITIGSTVYGGEYDARTGVLTVTHAFVTYDSNNVPFMQIGTISGGVKTRVFIRQSGVSQDISGVPDMLCNIAEPVEVNAQYTGVEGISIRVNANVNNQGFYIYNEDIQTLTEWQDYINNNSITVVYPLATPTTIQLPPCPIDILLGENNIWADTGDTTLQYPKFG